jgi:hypothetical protein
VALAAITDMRWGGGLVVMGSLRGLLRLGFSSKCFGGMINTDPRLMKWFQTRLLTVIDSFTMIPRHHPLGPRLPAFRVCLDAAVARLPVRLPHPTTLSPPGCATRSVCFATLSSPGCPRHEFVFATLSPMRCPTLELRRVHARPTRLPAPNVCRSTLSTRSCETSRVCRVHALFHPVARTKE